MAVPVFGRSKDKAVSPLIATVFTILFGVAMLAIVLNVINPVFDQAKDQSIVTDAFQNLELLNTAIKGVASESQGSTRTVPLSVTGGTYRTNTTYDWLYFEYEPEQDLRLTGTKGNVYVERGVNFIDYFNWYTEGSRPLPAWTNRSGQWTASDYKYVGQNGLAYHNVSETLENWRFSASITNSSGPTGGQVFALPTNPESLVIFLPFDNRSGSVAYDYSGNRNNGTLTNMSTIGNATSGWQNSSSCKAGRSCLMFDGVNDYVDTGYTVTLGTNGDFTVAMWMKTGTKVSSQVVAGFGSTTASWNRIQLDLDTNGKLRFYVRDDSGIANSYRDTTTDMSNGAWYHVVGTWSGSSNTATLYIDGTQKGSDSTNALGAITISHALPIGALNNNGAKSLFFNGTIDEVMWFNRSLSADEVEALYETSTKKLDATGAQSIAARTSPAIVLANSAGTTKFDDVKVGIDRKGMKMIVPYDNIDINGTMRATKGEHQIEIKHMGANAATGRTTVQITSS